MGNPRVCVIIPTLRNADELEIALEGLTKQTWEGALEIAIVGPTGDPGEAVAKSKGATWIDDAGSRTRADACNVALNIVDCDLVLFTDDDVWVPEDWVANLVRWFEREDVAGVGGPNFTPPDQQIEL